MSASPGDSPVEFTYDWYERFLDGLDERGLRVVGFEGGVGAGEVLLRHDVDYSPAKARRMGEIEADHGVESTFFFHLTGPYYNPLRLETREVMADLVGMGHAVGVHFSTHQYWSDEPDADEVTSAVARERDVLGGCVDRPAAAVSFHNPPDWVLGRRFDGFDSAYAPRYFTSVEYVADSNQRWREEGEHPFERSLDDGAQVLVHPFLWGARDGSTVDRIREARDRSLAAIERYTVEMNREWSGRHGLDDLRS